MVSINRKIVFITLLGLIPFYLKSFVYYFFSKIYLNFNFLLDELSLLYGAIIVSFISGMQWQRSIASNCNRKLIIPIIPLFIVWLYELKLFNFFSEILIIFSLFLSLLIDIFIINFNLSKWYLKLRTIVTFIAIFSYFL